MVYVQSSNNNFMGHQLCLVDHCIQPFAPLKVLEVQTHMNISLHYSECTCMPCACIHTCTCTLASPPFSLWQVNPVRRITIQGIRDHPWFIVGLPDYLFPLGDPGASQIDNLALSEVCQKLGVTSHEVVGALKGGEWYKTLRYGDHV